MIIGDDLKLQVSLFSATKSKDLEDFSENFLSNPVYIEIKDDFFNINFEFIKFT